MSPPKKDMAASDTLTEAAQKAQISRKTLYNYIRHDYEFSRAYKSLQEQAEIRAAEIMEEQGQQAAGVIMALMTDEKQPAAIRLKAAQAILEEGTRRGDQIKELAKEYCRMTAPSFPFDPAEIGM